jgi:uncharacterized membrane protein YphA (DoxX/SURF4 family)
MRESAGGDDDAWTGFAHGNAPVWWPVLTVAVSTGWSIGLILGIVVSAVAAVIVVVILYLAFTIASQANAAEQAVNVIRQQTDELGGIARVNDSGVRILHAARALRKVAVGK